MYITQTITVSPNTTRESPYALTIPMINGKIKRLWYSWRYGCADLCGFRATYHEQQLWPYSRNQWLPSFYTPIEIAENYDLDEPPYELTFELYNLDDTYEHTLFIGIEVERENTNQVLYEIIRTAIEDASYGYH